ncbi:MAG: LytTR family DNA-binding domain-containing protein, partial [Ruminococcus sp.]|nr:LytTR family DNA-binding domain-containing protein [Ruminococcus sp.]
MQINIALCDDDEEQVKNLRKLVCEWAEHKPFGVNIAEYESGGQFLFLYPDRPCGLLLLDIEMKGISGMELAKKLRSKGDMLPIVFITGFSDYMNEGYDVEALHYLLKPVDREKLFGVLDRYAANRERPKETAVTTEEGVRHIPVNGIVCIEAFGRKCCVSLEDKSRLMCCMSIKEFEGLPGFIHCHRSYIVNLGQVRTLKESSLVMETG